MSDRHDCVPACVPWTGTNKCHCSACGETFSVIRHFDAHRPAGVCLAPGRVGLVQTTRGVWLGKGEEDISERFK